MTTANKLPLGAAMKKYRNQYLMVAPFAIVFILFTVLPVAASIFLSFTSFNMTSMPEWVGLKNYVTLIVEDDVFLLDTSVHHHAKTAVSKRQPFLPCLGGGSVP